MNDKSVCLEMVLFNLVLYNLSKRFTRVNRPTSYFISNSALYCSFIVLLTEKLCKLFILVIKTDIFFIIFTFLKKYQKG